MKIKFKESKEFLGGLVHRYEFGVFRIKASVDNGFGSIVAYNDDDTIRIAGTVNYLELNFTQVRNLTTTQVGRLKADLETAYELMQQIEIHKEALLRGEENL